MDNQKIPDDCAVRKLNISVPGGGGRVWRNSPKDLKDLRNCRDKIWALIPFPYMPPSWLVLNMGRLVPRTRILASFKNMD